MIRINQIKVPLEHTSQDIVRRSAAYRTRRDFDVADCEEVD